MSTAIVTESETLGQKIKRLRIKKGLTQTELSIGLATASMISQIESDKATPSSKLLSGIAQKLNIPDSEFYDQIMEKAGDSRRYKMYLDLKQNGEYDKALEVLEGISEDSKYITADPRIEKAELALLAGQYEEALVYYKEYLDHHDPYVRAKVLLGMVKVYLKTNRLALAKHFIEQALRLQDGGYVEVTTDEYRLYGETLFMLGDYDKAISTVNVAIQRLQNLEASEFASLTEFYLLLAKCYEKVGLRSKALDEVRTSLVLVKATQNNQDKLILAQLFFAHLLLVDGNVIDAENQLNEVKEKLETFSIDTEIKFSYGLAMIEYYQETNQIDKALRMCETVSLGEHPKNEITLAVFYQTWGELYRTIGATDNAISKYLRSASVLMKNGSFGKVSTLYLTVGTIYKDLNNLEEAFKYTKMASEVFERSNW